MKTHMSFEKLVLPPLFFLTLAMALGTDCAKINAQEAVFLVQYPGKNADGTGLTDAGRRKANELANLLVLIRLFQQTPIGCVYP
jgi:hypothetical protein